MVYLEGGVGRLQSAEYPLNVIMYLLSFVYCACDGDFRSHRLYYVSTWNLALLQEVFKLHVYKPSVEITLPTFSYSMLKNTELLKVVVVVTSLYACDLSVAGKIYDTGSEFC